MSWQLSTSNITNKSEINLHRGWQDCQHKFMAVAGHLKASFWEQNATQFMAL
jgi:hypothetical protein